jgi:hypothetical protein
MKQIPRHFQNQMGRSLMRKSTVIKFFALLSGVFAVGQAAYAGGYANNVTITSMEANSSAGSSVFYVTFSSNLTNGASCGSAHPNTLAVTEASQTGAALISLIELAFTTGQTVSAVNGGGSCTVISGTEDLLNIVIG